MKKKALSKEEEEKKRGTAISCCTPLPQTWQIDYPLMVYKSTLASDNEIIIANLARRGDQQFRVFLGSWRFLCFVNHGGLADYRSFDPLHSRILFLARHNEFDKIRLFILDVDPWRDPTSGKDFGQLNVLITNDI